MLTLFLLAVHSVKVTVPIVSLYASAPTFFTLWSCLRLITLLTCPQHIYRRCDDHLYSLYQRFVLFYFQNWVNVKVTLPASRMPLHRSSLLQIYLHGDHAEIFKRKENVLYLSNHQSSGNTPFHCRTLSDRFILLCSGLDHREYVGHSSRQSRTHPIHSEERAQIHSLLRILLRTSNAPTCSPSSHEH